MKAVIASLFRLAFSIPPLQRYYFGVHKRIFFPLNLFKGVRKTIRYKKKFRLTLDLNDWICQNLYFLGKYEEKEIRFLETFLRPGDIFIDIGANIGLFSLIAAEAVGPAGIVYSFEPFSVNYQMLKSHIELNGVKNIVSEKLALGEKSGEITIHIDDKENNNGMATAYPAESTYSETVKAVSLDEYATEEKMGKIRAIKIDIEGGEFSALTGMKEVLTKYHPVIIIEINPEILNLTPYAAGDVDSFLRSLSYQKKSLDENGQFRELSPNADSPGNYVFV